MKSETFSYPDGMVIDVSKAMMLAVKNWMVPEQVRLEDLAIEWIGNVVFGERYVPRGIEAINYSQIHIDKDYAMTTNLTRPLLAYRAPRGDKIFVIDGFQRIFRAYKEEIDSLPACVMTYDMFRECVTNWGELPMVVDGRYCSVTASRTGPLLASPTSYYRRHHPSSWAAGCSNP